MKTKLSILFTFMLALSLSAQVGVNNNNPEQALDVNGKVKIADDGTDPSEGTMRYNNGDKQFEGYDGAHWNSFSSSKTSGLPSNPIPVFGYVNGVDKGEVKPLRFKSWTAGANLEEVPPGKLVIVTAIYPRPNALTLDQKYQVFLGPSDSQNGVPANQGERC